MGSLVTGNTNAMLNLIHPTRVWGSALEAWGGLEASGKTSWLHWPAGQAGSAGAGQEGCFCGAREGVVSVERQAARSGRGEAAARSP